MAAIMIDSHASMTSGAVPLLTCSRGLQEVPLDGSVELGGHGSTPSGAGESVGQETAAAMEERIYAALTATGIGCMLVQRHAPRIFWSLAGSAVYPRDDHAEVRALLYVCVLHQLQAPVHTQPDSPTLSEPWRCHCLTPDQPPAAAAAIRSGMHSWKTVVPHWTYGAQSEPMVTNARRITCSVLRVACTTHAARRSCFRCAVRGGGVEVERSALTARCGGHASAGAAGSGEHVESVTYAARYSFRDFHRRSCALPCAAVAAVECHSL